MTTIDSSVSVKSYHDALKKALNAVTTASKKLKKHIQAQYPDSDSQNLEVTTKLTVLTYMEDTASKQIQESSPTSAGLAMAVLLLEGYLAMTRDLYVYVSGLSQNTPDETKLMEALAKLSESVSEVQLFLANSTSQAQASSTPTMSSNMPVAQSVGDPASSGPGPVVALTPKITKQLPPDQENFVSLLPQVQGNLTRKLFENKRFSLSDRQINKLTQSWGQAISNLVKSSSTAEENLITVHNLLEILFDRLESNVQRASEDILVDLESPNI